MRCTQMVESEGGKCSLCEESCRCPCWCGYDDPEIIFERAPFLKKKFKSKQLEGSFNQYGNGQPPQPSRPVKRVRAPSVDGNAPAVVNVPGPPAAVLPPGFAAFSVPSAYPTIFAPKSRPAGAIPKTRMVYSGNRVPLPRYILVLVRKAFAEWKKYAKRGAQVKQNRLDVSAAKYTGHVTVIKAIIRSGFEGGVVSFDDAKRVIDAARSAKVTYKSLGKLCQVDPGSVSCFHRGEYAGELLVRTGNRIIQGLNRHVVEALFEAQGSEDGSSVDSLMLI